MVYIERASVVSINVHISLVFSKTHLGAAVMDC